MWKWRTSAGDGQFNLRLRQQFIGDDFGRFFFQPVHFFRQQDPNVRLRQRFVRYHIGLVAGLEHREANRRSLVRISQPGQSRYLLDQFQQSIDAFFRGIARVGRPAFGLDLQIRDALAERDNAVVGATAFEADGIIMLLRQFLDQFLGTRRTNLLVNIDQISDLGVVFEAAILKKFDRIESSEHGTFIVRHARSVGPVALYAERPFRRRANLEHGINVRHQQELAGARPGKRRHNVVGPARRGHVPDFGAHRLQLCRQDALNLIQARRMVSRRINIDQLRQICQNRCFCAFGPFEQRSVGCGQRRNRYCQYNK